MPSSLQKNAATTDGSDVIVFVDSSATGITGTAGAVPNGDKFTTIKADTSGNWSDTGAGIDVSGLADGVYYVYAYDRALIGSGVIGNIGTGLQITLDRAAPTLDARLRSVELLARCSGSSAGRAGDSAVDR